MPEGAFEIVMFNFVKPIHVQLSYKTIHLVMPEIFGQDELLKFGDVFDDELSAVGGPVNNFMELFDLG